MRSRARGGRALAWVAAGLAGLAVACGGGGGTGSGSSAEQYRHQFCALVAKNSTNVSATESVQLIQKAAQLARKAADVDPTYAAAADALVNGMDVSKRLPTASEIRAVDETCRGELTKAGVNVDQEEQTPLTSGP